MELLVDSREPASLRALFPGARVATLDNGDFQIVAEGGRPAVVFERKTYGDFVSSANSARLGDQTAAGRLRGRGDRRARQPHAPGLGGARLRLARLAQSAGRGRLAARGRAPRVAPAQLVLGAEGGLAPTQVGLEVHRVGGGRDLREAGGERTEGGGVVIQLGSVNNLPPLVRGS